MSLLAIDAPVGREVVAQPVQRFGSGGFCGEVVELPYLVQLGWSEHAWTNGGEECGSAGGEKLRPLSVALPGDGVGVVADAHAVGVDGEECVVLAEAGSAGSRRAVRGSNSLRRRQSNLSQIFSKHRGAASNNCAERLTGRRMPRSPAGLFFYVCAEP